MQILPPIPKPVAVEDTEADHLTPEPCAPPTPAIPNSASELSSACGPSESCSASTGCSASSPRAVLVVLSPSSRAEDNWCKKKTG
jgi:hypothetical protein